MTVSVNSLVETIRSILETSDLATLSRKMVRKQLETKFQSSMTEYKSLINETIEKIIAEQDENESDEDDEEEEEEEELQHHYRSTTTTTASSKNKKNIKSKAMKGTRTIKKNENGADNISGNGKNKKNNTTIKRRKNSNNNNEENEEKKAKNPKGALTSKVVLSPELAEITGQNEMTRPEIVKGLWAYIHEHNLQDPNDRRNILLDNKLKSVFGRDSFTMFTMNKYIKRHVRKPEEITDENTWETIERNGESSDEDEEKKAEKERKKEMRRLRRLEKKQENKKVKKKRVKKENSDDAPNGLNALFKISDEMKDFLNGEQISSRPNVIKKLWVYIKEKNLQNPENKREIICDDLLRKLFASDDRITMFQMNRLIGRHFLEKVENWQEIAKQGKLTEKKSEEKLKENEEHYTKKQKLETEEKERKIQSNVEEKKNHITDEIDDDDDDDDDDEDDDDDDDDDDEDDDDEE